MNWYTKRVGVILFALILLLTAGGGHSFAEGATLVGSKNSYSFKPMLAEVFVEKDGTISGTAIIEPEYDADLSLVVSGRKETSIQILGSSQNGKPKAGVVAKTTRGERGIVDLGGAPITIEVKTIEFQIPESVHKLSPGDYEVWLKASKTTASSKKSTDQLISNTVGMVIPDKKSGKAQFPGKLAITNNGSIQITIQSASASATAKYDLVVLDGDDYEVKRITLNPNNPNLTAKSLNLPAGEYVLVLELVDKNDTLRSNTVTLVVPTGSLPGTTGLFPANSSFPGEVTISKDGTIQITLQITSEYAKAKFNLLIVDDSDKVVKRIPISGSNPKVSTKGLALPAGNYTIMLEMVLSGKKTYSPSIHWVIPAQGSQTTFSIPSGQDFPGGIKVNKNGTITITLNWKPAYSAYTVYVVVNDLYGNIIKRIPLDLNKPSISIKDLNLATGGYTVVIEVVDPGSGLSATSLGTFITVNQTRQILIFIDGQLYAFPKPPVEVDGRTLVPLRAIFEALGAKVDWDEATQTVTATKDNNTITLTIGSRVAYKNGEKINLDVPAQLFNGDTTMVPIRFVSEALGAKVGWDEYSKAVVISNE